MQKTNKLLILLYILTCNAPIFAQEKFQFSIQQTIDYAKKNSVQVKNALLDVQIQQQVNREITAAAYPQLNGSVTSTYNPNIAVQVLPNFISPTVYGTLVAEGVKDGNGNTIKTPGDFGSFAAQFGTKYSTSVGFDASQLLFDGQVFVGLQARNTSIQLQQKNVEVTEENIKVNIYKIYYQLVVSKTQIALLDANIARLEKLSHDTKELYKNGFVEKLDVDKIDVQLTNLNTEKLKALNNINNGFIGLKVLIGMPVNNTLLLTDSINEEQIKEGILEATAYNYTDRKDFQFASLGKKLNEYNVKRYRYSQMPTLSLSGSYLKNAQRNEFDFFKDKQWFTISSVNLRLLVPIFKGFAAKAKISQAQLNVEKNNNQIEALKLSIDQDVETAKLKFNSAIITLGFQKKNITLAETVYNQTKKKYEIGTGSNIEINAAQIDLTQAQTNYINAVYDAIIARIDYLKASGKL